MLSDEASRLLQQGMSQLGLAEYFQPVVGYIALLQRWNRAYNLVARADETELVRRHILDCLSARPFIRHGPCLDVGSGAGLPGLILAVTMPGTEWVLLDANGKKTRFCVQAVRELGLKNVRVFQERIESYHPEHCFMTIISRAYSQAADFVCSSKHLLCNEGQILALKGHIAEEEKASAEAVGMQLQIESIYAPGQTGERHMMIFKH